MQGQSIYLNRARPNTFIAPVYRRVSGSCSLPDEETDKDDSVDDPFRGQFYNNGITTALKLMLDKTNGIYYPTR